MLNPLTRDAEPEPEPTNFGLSRSRSRRNGLLGAGIGAGAVKNGAAPAPKSNTIDLLQVQEVMKFRTVT